MSKLPTANVKQLLKNFNVPPGMEDVMNEEFLTNLLQNAEFDPATGQPDDEKMLRYLSSQRDAPWYQKAMTATQHEQERLSERDMSHFDFSSLPSMSETWTLELHKDMDWPLQIDGKEFLAKQWLMLCNSPKTPRLIRASRSKPTEFEVMTFVRDSFVNVPFTFKPGLPTVLLVSPTYMFYQRVLRTFFDSLPRPFSWKFDTGEKKQGLDKSHIVVDVLINVGHEWKRKGNEALAGKDIAQALEAYTSGIDHLNRALDDHGPNMKPDKLDSIHKLLAVCFANRAAVYLMDGKEFSPKKAKKDGRLAETVDPTYAKAYYRLARAHERLGDVEKARKVLRRALQQRELENDANIRQELDRYLAMAA